MQHRSVLINTNPQPIRPLPILQDRLLRVETEYFVAGAIFHGPKCVHAAPILNWMRVKTPAQIHTALLKMGARWSWSPISGQGSNPKADQKADLQLIGHAQ